MDIDYAIDKEKDDNRYLKDFNDSTHFFTKLEETEHFNRHDFDGIDRDGRPVAIEHKARTPQYNLEFFKTHPIYIEVDKFRHLKQQDAIPLYINYLENGKYVLIFPLDNINECELARKETLIQNFSKQIEEYVERLLLPLELALIYKKDGLKYKRILI